MISDTVIDQVVIDIKRHLVELLGEDPVLSVLEITTEEDGKFGYVVLIDREKDDRVTEHFEKTLGRDWCKGTLLSTYKDYIRFDYTIYRLCQYKKAFPESFNVEQAIVSLVGI